MGVEITNKKELEAELENKEHKGKVIIVDFHATWCGPCVRIEPKIKAWGEDDFKESVAFLKCDVDQAEELAEEYKVESMPTFLFFKDGKEVDRIVGGDAEKLKAAIEKNIK